MMIAVLALGLAVLVTGVVASYRIRRRAGYAVGMADRADQIGLVGTALFVLTIVSVLI